MASEKVTAMIEEVKALSVLELAELVHALRRPSAFPPPPLPRLKRRPSLTLS